MSLVKSVAEAGLSLAIADVFQEPVLRRQARRCQEAPPVAKIDVIAPFSLLPDGLTMDAGLKQLQKHHDIDPSEVEDIYACTPLQEGLMACH